MAKIQAGFFDEQFKLERISKLGDPLEKLNATIDFELFRYMPQIHSFSACFLFAVTYLFFKQLKYLFI